MAPAPTPSHAQAQSLPTPPPKQKPTVASNSSQSQQHTTQKLQASSHSQVHPPPVPTSTQPKSHGAQDNARNTKAQPRTQQIDSKPAPQPAAATSKGESSANTSANTAQGTGVGTGEHLRNLRVKRGSADQNQASGANRKPAGEFDFSTALSAFNKEEVMASVASDSAKDVAKEPAYKKDDFFDSLSCDVLDKEHGLKTRMSNSEERALNQDTFGAFALQNGYRGRGRGGRGGYGRGGGGGRGAGGYEGNNRQGGRESWGNAVSRGRFGGGRNSGVSRPSAPA